MFSELVADAPGTVPLQAGVIARYNASGLADGDLVLELPAAPTRDEVTGVKEVGGSTVSVIISGNGNLVESATEAPAASQSNVIARQSLTLQYDGAGTWWVV